MRQRISLDDSIMSILVKMSEGNPGAASVLGKLMQSDNEFGLVLALHLDDMNIRGSQIWVAYKDHCGEDLEKLKAAIVERDPSMIATVNKECSYTGEIAKR